jgi:hypothetical protein
MIFDFSKEDIKILNRALSFAIRKDEGNLTVECKDSYMRKLLVLKSQIEDASLPRYEDLYTKE